MKIEKFEKLLANLHGKTEYVALECIIERGLK